MAAPGTIRREIGRAEWFDSQLIHAKQIESNDQLWIISNMYSSDSLELFKPSAWLEGQNAPYKNAFINRIFI